MKKLFKIGISIYFLICLLLSGSISTLADEVKPIHEYTFDKDSGTTVIDSGSNAKNGTAKGTEISKSITGYNGIGYAKHFDKVKRQYIKFGKFSIPNSARSIRFQIRRDGIPTSVQSECILSTLNTNDQLSSLVRINGDQLPNPGKLQIMILENSVFNCISPDSICDGKWHDVLFTYDSKMVKLYIDDMDNPVFTQSGDYSHKSSYTENRITIGSYEQDSVNAGCFQGDLDNIQIYASAINPNSTKPSMLTAVGGESKVELTWNAVNGASGYTVKRSTTAGGPYTTIASDVTGTTYTDVGIADETVYYYVATAVINGKESGESNEAYASATIPTLETPSGLKALGGDSKVDLSWNGVSNATSYIVKRSTTAGGPYTTIAGEVTGTTYTDTGVTNGVTYYYIVAAIAQGRESGGTDEVLAEPTQTATPPTTEAKLKVVLEVSESLRLSVDDDLNINTQMAWSSSDNTVATVNEKGIVTALATGNTVITVKSIDGSYTDYINVLVVENADDYRLAINLKVGETARLTADDFTNTANVTWAPMDSSIANVTSKGKVTALSKGLVLISAKDADGNIIGRVYVRVRE